MYETHFGFACRPFAAAPCPDQYFAADSIESARQTLTRVIERAEGPALVVGPAGIGKSMLCQVMAKQSADRFQVAILASARVCTRRALLQNILFELKLPYRDLEEGELRLSLMDHLEPSRDRTEGLLLLVDEAQSLPFKLLEELRLITNLVRDGQPRVRLVLIGNANLEERFAHPKLNSFNQRLAARVFLTTLTSEETEGYIRAALNRAGGESMGPFTDDAVAAIHRTTGGVPRLINQLCDHSLIMAAVGGVTQLDAAGIEEAWADLQQLPLPTTTKNAYNEDVIEFGALDDEPLEQSDDSSATLQVIGDDAAAFEPDAADESEAPLVSSVVALDDLDEAVGPHDQAEFVPLAEPLDQIAGSLDDETQPDTASTVLFEPTEEPVDPPEVVTSAASSTEQEPAQFEPLGLVESEVELVFQSKPEYAQLFGGKFEDEEVVVDRYASLEDQARRQPAAAAADAADSPATKPKPVGVVDDLKAVQPPPIRLAQIREEAPSIKLEPDVDVRIADEPAAETDEGFAWVAGIDSKEAEVDSADDYVARPFDPADDPVLPESRFSVAQSQFDVFASRNEQAEKPPTKIPPAPADAASARSVARTEVADSELDRETIAVSEKTAQTPAAENALRTDTSETETKSPKRRTKRVFGQLFARLRHG